MSTIEAGSRFLRRFDDVTMRVRRIGLSKAVGLGCLIAVAGISLMVLADYWFELPREFRLAGLLTTIVCSIGLFAWSLMQTLRRWGKNQTAASIEANFPELGQSVRTAVEFGRVEESKLREQGFAPSLVSAMHQQTDRATLPLDLLSIVKTGVLILIVGLLCFLLGSLITGSAVDSEWRTALQRSIGIEVPYTTIAAGSGNFRVVEGDAALLSLDVKGRTDRPVTLFTRPASDTTAEWSSQTLTNDDKTSTTAAADRYEIELAEVAEPFEYRFSAGPLNTSAFTVSVKYPVRIQNVEVTVTPPEYTRLKPETAVNESIAAVENSHAGFQVTFDRPPVSSRLLLKPASDRTIEPREIPLTAADDPLSLLAEMDITTDWRFVVSALDEDDIETLSPEYNIRMRRDQPPRVWFDEPGEEVEVHTLAEINLRVRVSDDFGLKNAGIVFEVNNESEHELTATDFAELLAAAEAAGQNPGPMTHGSLERLLPLEFFELTQRDSVSYYAYVEDNRPNDSQRVESDLRFIDIRPFMQRFELFDPEDPMAGVGGGERVMFLGELTKRERALLNRTRRVARRAADGMQPDTTTTDSLIEEQQTIADGVLRLVQFLQDRNIGGDELLFEAHEVMLSNIDALAGGDFDDAVLLERDAIKLLVEGREVLTQLISRLPPKARAQLRQFSRQQTQKIRRPKSEEEELEELVEQIRELMRDEEQISQELCDCMTNGGGSEGEGQNGQGNGSGENGSNGQGKAETDPANNKNDNNNSAQENDDPDSGDDETDEPDMDTAEQLRKVEDRQNDVAVQARAIEDRINQVDRLTDLVRERAAAAAKSAEESASALARGNTDDANRHAVQAQETFGKLAEHVDGILRKEASQRVAAARDLANRIAQQQRKLDSELTQAAKNPNGQGTSSQANQGNGRSSNQQQNTDGKSGDAQEDDEDQKNEDEDQQGAGDKPELSDEVQDALAKAAEELQEDTRTLEDLMKSIAASDRPEDQRAANEVERLIDEQDISSLVEQMRDVQELTENQEFASAGTSARAVASKMEITSQTLEKLHRRLVAPRIEELVELEKQAARLLQQMENVESKGDVEQSRMSARELLDKIEDSGLNVSGVEALEDALRNVAWGLGPSSQAYSTPKKYIDATTNVVEDLQLRIQELLLGDIFDQSGEVVPAEYKKLVERYYRVLSAEEK